MSLSCADIYYTTDESNPVLRGTKYTSAISVSSSLTIKSAAVKTGWKDSEIISAAYPIRSESGSSGGRPVYSIVYPAVKHGSVSVAPANASSGAKVTLTVEPDKGYTLETLTVNNCGYYELCRWTGRFACAYFPEIPAGH